MKYFYVNDVGIGYDKFNENTRKSEEGSHKYLIRNFIDLYHNKTKDRYESRNLRNEINALKASRQESDYDNKEINYDFSTKALNKSKEIINTIKAAF